MESVLGYSGTNCEVDDAAIDPADFAGTEIYVWTNNCYKITLGGALIQRYGTTEAQCNVNDFTSYGTAVGLGSIDNTVGKTECNTGGTSAPGCLMSGSPPGDDLCSHTMDGSRASDVTVYLDASQIAQITATVVETGACYYTIAVTIKDSSSLSACYATDTTTDDGSDGHFYCINGGTIGGTTGGCTCTTCNTGYSGNNCEVADACAATTTLADDGTDGNFYCINGGTATGNTGTGTCGCDCAAGYSGTNCEVADACAATSTPADDGTNGNFYCVNNGEIAGLTGSCTCACSSGGNFEGANCDRTAPTASPTGSPTGSPTTSPPTGSPTESPTVNAAETDDANPNFSLGAGAAGISVAATVTVAAVALACFCKACFCKSDRKTARDEI